MPSAVTTRDPQGQHTDGQQYHIHPHPNRDHNADDEKLEKINRDLCVRVLGGIRVARMESDRGADVLRTVIIDDGTMTRSNNRFQCSRQIRLLSRRRPFHSKGHRLRRRRQTDLLRPNP